MVIFSLQLSSHRIPLFSWQQFYPAPLFRWNCPNPLGFYLFRYHLIQNLWCAIQCCIVETNTHTTIAIKIQIAGIDNHNSAFFMVSIEDLKTFETHYISSQGLNLHFFTLRGINSHGQRPLYSSIVRTKSPYFTNGLDVGSLNGNLFP